MRTVSDFVAGDVTISFSESRGHVLVHVHVNIAHVVLIPFGQCHLFYSFHTLLSNKKPMYFLLYEFMNANFV